MARLSFHDYVAMRDGLLLPDRPPAAGMSRINPFPATQDRLKRLLARPPKTGTPPARRNGVGIDYRAAVDHGLLP